MDTCRVFRLDEDPARIWNMADWLSHHTLPQGFIAVRQVPNISLRDSPAWDAPNSSAFDVLVAVSDCLPDFQHS
eukprot:2402902-Amphidinium_carterae.1